MTYNVSCKSKKFACMFKSFKRANLSCLIHSDIDH